MFALVRSKSALVEVRLELKKGTNGDTRPCRAKEWKRKKLGPSE